MRGRANFLIGWWIGYTDIGSEGSFYDIFADCLGVAARQLGVDLEVVGGTKQRAPMLAQGREIVEGSSRPDYLLLVNYMNVGQDLLPLSAASGVGTFLGDSLRSRTNLFI